MRRILTGLILCLSLTGCGSQIADFVGSRDVPDTVLPSTANGSPVGSKMSPGANLSRGSAVKSRFAITTSQRTAAGAQVKSTFGFHQNRPN